MSLPLPGHNYSTISTLYGSALTFECDFSLESIVSRSHISYLPEARLEVQHKVVRVRHKESGCLDWDVLSTNGIGHLSLVLTHSQVKLKTPVLKGEMSVSQE